MLFSLVSLYFAGLIHRPSVTEHKSAEERFSSLTLATGIFSSKPESLLITIEFPSDTGLRIHST